MYSAFNILNNIRIGRPTLPAQRHPTDITACVTFLRTGSLEAPAKPGQAPETSSDLPLLFAQYINNEGSPEEVAGLPAKLLQLAQSNRAPEHEQARLALLLDYAMREFMPKVMGTVELYGSAHLARKLAPVQATAETLAADMPRINDFLASRMALLPAISISSPRHEGAAYVALEALMWAGHNVEQGATEEAARNVMVAFSTNPQFVNRPALLGNLLKIGAPAFPSPLDVLTQDRLHSLAKLTNK